MSHRGEALYPSINSSHETGEAYNQCGLGFMHLGWRRRSAPPVSDACGQLAGKHVGGKLAGSRSGPLGQLTSQ